MGWRVRTGWNGGSPERPIIAAAAPRLSEQSWRAWILPGDDWTSECEATPDEIDVSLWKFAALPSWILEAYEVGSRVETMVVMMLVTATAGPAMCLLANGTSW